MYYFWGGYWTSNGLDANKEYGSEDMMQLFWDLGDASENGLGLPKREHLAGYYFSMVAEGGWPEAIEKMTHYREGGLFKRWKRVR